MFDDTGGIPREHMSRHPLAVQTAPDSLHRESLGGKPQVLAVKADQEERRKKKEEEHRFAWVCRFLEDGHGFDT